VGQNRHSVLLTERENIVQEYQRSSRITQENLSGTGTDNPSISMMGPSMSEKSKMELNQGQACSSSQTAQSTWASGSTTSIMETASTSTPMAKGTRENLIKAKKMVSGRCTTSMGTTTKGIGRST
jgi:hypothetical protein